jgi:hypothetical protein
MGFELCYLPDMPAVLRALAGAENSIERWCPAGPGHSLPAGFSGQTTRTVMASGRLLAGEPLPNGSNCLSPCCTGRIDGARIPICVQGMDR